MRRRWMRSAARARLSTVLFKFGFQRLPKYDKFHYPAEAFKRHGDVDEKQPPRVLGGSRALVVSLAFVGVAVLVLIAYGLGHPGPSLSTTRQAACAALQAIVQHEAGNPRLAQSLRQAAERGLSSGPALAFMQAFFATVEHPMEAVAESRRLRSPEDSVREAGRRRGLGDLTGAVEALRRASQARRQDEVVRLLYADTLITAGMNDEALKQADALGTMGFELAGCDLRARVYLAQDKPQDAAHELMAALTYAPASPALRVDLADAQLRAGDERAAVRAASQALAADSSNGAAYAIIGGALLMRGDVPGAEQALRKAVALDPTSPVALNNLAWVVGVVQHRPKAGLLIAQKAYQLAPQRPTVVDTLGWLHHLLGDDKRALPLLRAAATGPSPLPEAQWHAAQLALQGGTPARALPFLQTLARSPRPTALREKARKELAKL